MVLDFLGITSSQARLGWAVESFYPNNFWQPYKPLTLPPVHKSLT
jgi:hypothetical protein